MRNSAAPVQNCGDPAGVTSAGRDVIAVLLDDYVDYQRVIVDSVKPVVQASGYGMLCIAARKLDSVDGCHRGASANRQQFHGQIGR